MLCYVMSGTVLPVLPQTGATTMLCAAMHRVDSCAIGRGQLLLDSCYNRRAAQRAWHRHLITQAPNNTVCAVKHRLPGDSLCLRIREHIMPAGECVWIACRGVQ